VPDALEALTQITDQLNSLSQTIARPKPKTITPAAVQPITSAIARTYFEAIRPELRSSGVRPELVQELDNRLQALLSLASAARDRTAYAELPKLSARLLDATVELMKAKGDQRLVLSPTEQEILRKLAEVSPVCADSYEQALRDIAHGVRVSWRGTATEMREVLREVMHHYAPDDQVTAAPGYANEDGQSRPTQRQRVRFILARRRTPTEAIEQAEGTLDTVEGLVSQLARTTYKRMNASTHGSTGLSEVRNLQRYMAALLGEILLSGDLAPPAAAAAAAGAQGPAAA